MTDDEHDLIYDEAEPFERDDIIDAVQTLTHSPMVPASVSTERAGDDGTLELGTITTDTLEVHCDELDEDVAISGGPIAELQALAEELRRRRDDARASRISATYDEAIQGIESVIDAYALERDE